MEAHIATWKLIPSKGGVYHFEVNGATLFSKQAAGRHAEPGELKTLLIAHLAALGLPYYEQDADTDDDH